ncbi:MAG: uncharacterized protein QOK04_1892 [Solirubrobacteraceae bacterium]|jgi:uncharacterized membrane protein YedE/YeeE|nr:uncharacterized protein [Solirubrobacteraceae bacterium]
MSARLAAGLVGVVFGVALSWTGMTSPEVIRQALVLQSSYLFLMFGSAVAVAFVGMQLARRRRMRAVITGAPIDWTTARPRRNVYGGAVLFGIGWAISDACPGPVATQLGQGILWSLCTIAGIVIGIRLYASRQERTAGVAETDAGDQAKVQRPAAVPGSA